MSSNPNFIPQLGITQQILEGINLANQQKADQQAAAARQRQLDIADKEASVGAQRLQVETPYYAAQTSRLLTESQLQAQALARNQFASDYLAGNSGHGSEPHLSAVVGNNGAFGLSPEPPVQPLSVSNPIGQTLATPTAPVSTAASAPDQTTPASESAERGSYS
jgi:hypothetical protein